MKDILNSKYGEGEGASSVADTPAHDDAATEEGVDEGVEEEGVEEEGVDEGVEEEGVEEEGVEEGDESLEPNLGGDIDMVAAAELAASIAVAEGAAASHSSDVDLMDTLPLNDAEVGPQEWPPCPWIPKSSLRRWKQPKRSMTTTSLEETDF